MQRKQKLTVVAIVMGIGLALAMLFMQPANHLSQAERDSAAKSDSSGFSATPFTTTRRENSAPGGTVSPSTNPSTFKQYSVEPRLSGTIEPLDADGARPTVLDRPSAPTEFTPFRPANQRLVDQQHPSSTQANNDPVRQPTGEYGNQFRAEDPSELEDNRADGGSAAWPHEPVERKHKVVDGDSLTALAQKYLGNPDRAEDLFYYNRDILRSGELLPLGKELRIPPADFRPPALPATEVETSKQLFPVIPLRPPAVTSPTATRPYNAPSPPSVSLTSPMTSTDVATAASPSSSGRMVNVWRSASTGSNPLRSAPVTGSNPAASDSEPRIASSRSYTVESHDTLSLIARKVYGDVQHKNILLQANSSQLRSPQDLRPGMVLAVPVLDPARAAK